MQNTIISQLDLYSEAYWYSRFDELSAQVPGGFTRKDLVDFDKDFDLAKANNYIRNVKYRKAGLKVLVKVCTAVEKLIEHRQASEVNPEVIRTRQKLLSSL